MFKLNQFLVLSERAYCSWFSAVGSIKMRCPTFASLKKVVNSLKEDYIHLVTSWKQSFLRIFYCWRKFAGIRSCPSELSRPWIMTQLSTFLLPKSSFLFSFFPFLSFTEKVFSFLLGRGHFQRWVVGGYELWFSILYIILIYLFWVSFRYAYSRKVLAAFLVMVRQLTWWNITFDLVTFSTVLFLFTWRKLSMLWNNKNS